jgi:hypothetical protein
MDLFASSLAFALVTIARAINSLPTSSIMMRARIDCGEPRQIRLLSIASIVEQRRNRIGERSDLFAAIESGICEIFTSGDYRK